MYPTPSGTGRVNVIQLSARDIQVTSRQSTGTLATSQLVLMDDRSIYLDFFGMVLGVAAGQHRRHPSRSRSSAGRPRPPGARTR